MSVHPPLPGLKDEDEWKRVGREWKESGNRVGRDWEEIGEREG